MFSLFDVIFTPQHLITVFVREILNFKNRPVLKCVILGLFILVTVNYTQRDKRKDFTSSLTTCALETSTIGLAGLLNNQGPGPSLLYCHKFFLLNVC